MTGPGRSAVDALLGLALLLAAAGWARVAWRLRRHRRRTGRARFADGSLVGFLVVGVQAYVYALVCLVFGLILLAGWAAGI